MTSSKKILVKKHQTSNWYIFVANQAELTLRRTLTGRAHFPAGGENLNKLFYSKTLVKNNGVTNYETKKPS